MCVRGGGASGGSLCLCCTCMRPPAARLPLLNSRIATTSSSAGAMFAFADNAYNGPVATFAHGLMSATLTQVGGRVPLPGLARRWRAGGGGCPAAASMCDARCAGAEPRQHVPNATPTCSKLAASARRGSRRTPRCGTPPPGFCRPSPLPWLCCRTCCRPSPSCASAASSGCCLR